MNGYYIVLIVLALAITIMYVAEKVADIFRAKYENLDKIIKNNKNCQIRITKEKVSDKYENTKDFKEK